MTTNGNADDITKVYDSVNKSRLGIAGKLKGIARIINNSLDSYDYNVVADDNSITSIELINLHLTNADIPLVITDITTNGNANDINKVYAIVDNHRFDIGSKLKDIARIIDDGIDDYECGIICINAYDDKYDDETETDGLI